MIFSCHSFPHFLYACCHEVIKVEQKGAMMVVYPISKFYPFGEGPSIFEMYADEEEGGEAEMPELTKTNSNFLEELLSD
jgi:hypothetical protein